MINYEIIYKKYSLNPDSIVLKKTKDRADVTVSEFIRHLYEYGKESAKYLGIHSVTLNKHLKSIFPGINLMSTSRRTWPVWLLFECGYKKCACCNNTKEVSEFHTDNSRPDRLRNYCKDCSRNKSQNHYINNRDSILDYKKEHYLNSPEVREARAIYNKEYQQKNRDIVNYHASKRRAVKLQAIAPWANFNKIKEIYENCPEGYQVDHIYPLQGVNSCGLHVETNLQYLTSKDNRSKGNRLPEEVLHINGIIPNIKD